MDKTEKDKGAMPDEIEIYLDEIEKSRNGMRWTEIDLTTPSPQKPGDLEGLKREVCTTFDKVEGSKYGFEYGAIEWTIDHLAATGRLNPVREGLSDNEREIDLSGIIAGTHMIVPIEPDEGMIGAAQDAADGWYEIDGDKGPWLRSDGFAASYKAMLAAAITGKDQADDR